MPGPVIARIPKSAREEVRVSLETWRGRHSIDVRVYAQLADPSGEIVPTKKGASLPIAKLPELITALQDAKSEAARLGLIEGQP